MERMIIGVSLPRSGHHYLAELLLAVLSPDLEHVGRPHGAETPSPGKILFVKNHDTDGNLNPHQRAFYLIQHREPRRRFLSEALRQAVKSPAIREAALRANRAFWARWLEMATAASIRFHDKWLVTPPRLGLIIDYDWLKQSPASVVCDVLHAIGADDKMGRVANACARLAEWQPIGSGNLDAPRPPFAPRDLGGGQFIPEDLLDEYVEKLRSQCPIWMPPAAHASALCQASGDRA